MIAKIYSIIERKTDFCRNLTIPLIDKISKETKSSEIVLDAGSGDLRYKKYFNHCKYISADFQKVSKPYGETEIICDLEKIPLKDNSVDKIICIWVFEHLKEPEKVLIEFKRILKKKGKIYIISPQGHPEHEIPYDYLRYTQFWYDYMKTKLGFNKIKVIKMGSYWHVLAHTIFIMPQTLPFYKNKLLRFTIGLPFYGICTVLAYILPIFSFLDKEKKLVIGYFVKYEK